MGLFHVFEWHKGAGRAIRKQCNSGENCRTRIQLARHANLSASCWARMMEDEKKPLAPAEETARLGDNPPAAELETAVPDVPLTEQEALERDLGLLLRAENGDPFRVLGPHFEERDGVRRLVIRVLQPHAAAVEVLIGNEAIPAARVHPEGIFEVVLESENALALNSPGPSSYRLRMRWRDGSFTETYDAYAFGPVLTPFDLYLLGEGTHYQSYLKLGAHVREVEGVRGVHFAVWAPNARRVSIVGDFDSWDGRVHPMRSCGGSGVWEIFLPGLGSGVTYKYEIRSRLGALPFLKADPYAFESELRPKSGSVVAELNTYDWGDQEWMRAARGTRLGGAADVGLRSAPGIVAARGGRGLSLADVSRAGRAIDSLCEGAGLYAFGTDAGDGASL